MRLTAPPLHDPAWPRRLAALLTAAVLLWPLLQATEFRPWLLWQDDALRVTEIGRAHV